ncbi:unnamed protein product [Meganyctiphanes norvegica]|uniref:Integrase catalytic domain-containing protein n=1 Tax=Meganyctiphanes norvegica TaxID=48144 RepID=A0AAV2SBK6_MEGNR
MEGLNVGQHRCTPYNPRSNSVCERMNQTILQVLRSLLEEFPVSWDRLLPTVVQMYNAGYHSSLCDTPFYLMFVREANVNYEAILAAESHDEVTVRSRASEAAICLRLAREAIASSQDKRYGDIPPTSRSVLEVGMIVYLKEHHVSKKDHKILPRWHGPFRLVELLGAGTCIVKSLKSGRTKQVSFRDVKVLPHTSLTKTENKNVDEVFPVRDTACEVPSNIPQKDISRHGDDVGAFTPLEGQGGTPMRPGEVAGEVLAPGAPVGARSCPVGEVVPQIRPGDVRLDAPGEGGLSASPVGSRAMAVPQGAARSVPLGEGGSSAPRVDSRSMAAPQGAARSVSLGEGGSSAPPADSGSMAAPQGRTARSKFNVRWNNNNRFLEDSPNHGPAARTRSKVTREHTP